MTALLLTFNLLCVGDAVTTHLALAQGATEQWLPIRNPWLIDSVVGASAVGGTLALHTLAHDHPKAAKHLVIALVLVRGVFLAHNLRQLAHQRGG